jgi:RNA polymerase sigma-70 factor (ECF subfamily)
VNRTATISPSATIDSPARDVPLQAHAANRLGELFDLHQARLYRLALRMSRDPEEARDLLQETFLRAARRPGSIPAGEAAAEAWLVRVLVNLCRDRWRRLKVRRQAGPAPRWSVDTPADPEAAQQARETIRAALATLRPRTRAVILMHEIEGLDKRSIAALLGITEVTVRWHLASGRGRLRRQLSPGKDERYPGADER